MTEEEKVSEDLSNQATVDSKVAVMVAQKRDEGMSVEKGGVETKVEGEELENGEEGRDYEFGVGDIVWVETKMKTWWPGKIHDPVDALKLGMANEQQGCFLVAHFGNGHVAWCVRQQLKPFVQYFDRISGESTGKVFLRAVEKALEELGDRVRMNMTCACVLKPDHPLSVEDNAASEKGATVHDQSSGEVGDLSITHFDSVAFLSHLKSLAQVVSKVGMLDFVVMQNRLSAFSSFTGHSQVPMHLLQEGSDARSNADGTVKKQMEEKNVSGIEYGDSRNRVTEFSAESRERKRSRYLSYPYVNLGQTGSSAGVDDGLSSNFKSPGEKFWMKWYKRFTGVNNTSSCSFMETASSAELISEFYSAAIDRHYPFENKTFDSVAWFISNFRISVFHEEPVCETYSKYMAGQDEDKYAESCPLEHVEKFEGKSEPRKRSKISVSKNAAGEDTANTSSLIQSPGTVVQGTDVNTGKKIGRSKLGKSKTKSIAGMPDVKTSIVPDEQKVQDTLVVRPLVPCDNQKKTEKAECASLATLQTKQTIGIPDLNRSIVIPTVVLNYGQSIGHDAIAGNFKGEKGLETEAASEHSKSVVAPGIVDANGHSLRPGTLVVDLGIPPAFLSMDQVTGLLSAESKPAPKKRKRKDKVNPGIAVHSDNVPDLNGNDTESLAPPSKPVRKRRRKGEALATALLLSFVPGVPMPTKDDLISTFCRFGPLKESETHLNDAGSAQVVFMESADAGEAFQSLEKNNPFGTSLMDYKRFNLPSVSKVLATSLASPPTKRLLSPVQSPAKGPCLDDIRQNLQMMTSMLEKSGDTISPEMRAKLECEIKGLLQKVTSTDGSSA